MNEPLNGPGDTEGAGGHAGGDGIGAAGRQPPPTGGSKPRPDASMTLITTVLERPLEPGYQEAADRRTSSGLPAATSTRTVIVVVMAIVTGFLFAVAAQSLRPKPTAAASVKEELVSRIEGLQTHGTAQEASIVALTRQVHDLEAAELAQAGGSDLTATINTLEQQAGIVAVAGPGVTLTLDDAASAGGNADAGNRPSSGFEAGRVSSADLQVIVNGLWAAGAEAVSINGHRLTATSAIRFAGQAIIVDFRPLTRPYTVTALGDPDTLRSRFEPSFGGVYLTQLSKEFGIVSSLTAGDSLSVPGAPGERLLVAEPLGALPGNAGAPSVSTATPSETTLPSGVETP
ncbi:MAG: DUF881 domain-containing protein [Humibacillus sp.]|nr:DUF881 domain-containing protein [Humibacillus sp.]MDN5776156.1 DUF881 domain-containing protein [Humibacillus sp.]